MDCADCAARLEKAVASLDGVMRSAVNFATAKLKVEYDPAKLHRGDIISQIKKMGYDIAAAGGPGNKQETVLRLSGLDCADCAAKLQKAVEKMPGVDKANINFAAATLTVEHSTNIQSIIKTIQQMGYQAREEGAAEGAVPSFWVKNRRALTTVVSGIFAGAGFISGWFNAPENLVITLFSLAVVTGGYFPAKAGFYSLRRGFSMDMNVLMTIAVVGAMAIGQWEEAATVVFLFSLGNALEAYSMEKTRNSIRDLMDLAPEEAVVRREGREETLPVSEITVGDVVIVRPGERIPMDGKIIYGQSAINQAPITGESVPVDKKVGDEVFAGTINGSGALEIQVTKLVQDTTLARIIKMVEKAQEQRAPSQRFVDVFARYYTPAVIGLALLLAVVPPLFMGQSFAPWFYRALTLLVVSCPCALVISTPVSVVSAIGNAAKQGVLIKGGAYLEGAGKVKVAAFDKTGTLTVGCPQVTDVVTMPGYTKEQVLAAAAAVEVRSEHPIAEAVLKEAEKLDVHFSVGENFVSLPGKGAKAKVDGRKIYIGNLKLFQDDLKLDIKDAAEILLQLQREGKTPVLVGSKAGIWGIIAVADRVRESSYEAINKLQKMGIQSVMLTGDNEGTARAIAGQVGIDKVKSNLLPGDKVQAVKELQENYDSVAMVGDGINDAPALATANLGIAMGGAGTDAALETADVAIMSDDPSKVVFLIKLSKKTLEIIRQNIVFALVVKIAAVMLVFPGILNLWLAILADTGAALAVIANGLRLRKVKI
ncbi:Cd2+/Zn2+-exporting ATPase [Desulfohalotomaculum tongense]|uniref:heavy metal translocating P-type ATPase n=1 Tax=Desulforadius tongensis TaxID=1216062 RepID=UPI00195F06CA|nr:heavy metal translocating P-type ATPase [Desulforadius tongensis]MBM7856004.1 Cd2+/Zn2+-exporting ATPase [Desulforadius tongensis]